MAVRQDRALSDAALGAKRCGAVMTSLAAHGYRCARISASGQRRGKRIAEQCLAGDTIARAPDGLPHLLVEVGGAGKRVVPALAELRGSLFPGMRALVVRFVRRRRWYYWTATERHSTLEAALAALKDQG